MASQLTNPLLYQTREGSLEDPYVDKVESVKPVDGRAVLEEVPVKEFGVIVDGYIEKATNTPSGTEFYVDYTNGVLYFRPNLDATVTVRYKGRGVVLIPAERIYYGDAENNQTLDVSLTSINSLMGTYEDDIQRTNEATGLATQATAFAQEQGAYALAQGDYAKAMGLNAKGTAEAAVGSALSARDLALEKAQLADAAARTAKVTWLDPVETFADIATTYPNPVETNQVQTKDDGAIYRFENGQWNSHLFSPVHPQNMARHKNRFVATEGQTVFTLSKAYFTNQDRIDVYVSGVKQVSGVDFNETSPTTITLTSGATAGDVVEAVYFKTTEAQALDLIEQVQDAEAATSAANTAATNANTKATLADQKATLANEKATLADQKATAATTATTQANTARDSANAAATNATTQATHAKTQGDYAKAQGDLAKGVVAGVIPNATQNASGLQSAADKTALDNGQKWRLTRNDGVVNYPANGTNFETLVNSGFYMFSNDFSHVGQPENRNYWIVEVFNYDNTNVIQRWSAIFGNVTYIRRKTAQGWLSFTKQADENTLTSTLMGNKITVQSNANFIGKVSGSTTVNPHTVKRTTASNVSGYTILQTPSSVSIVELSDLDYGKIRSLDSESSTTMIPHGAYAAIAQHLFSFNLIEHVQRTYGTIPGATTAEKVTWLKANISRQIYSWWGFGSSPVGVKATIALWSGNGWTTASSHGLGSINKLSSSQGSTTWIQPDGFVHLLAYADPSDETTASVINTDYVELQVELSTDIKTNLLLGGVQGYKLTADNGSARLIENTSPLTSALSPGDWYVGGSHPDLPVIGYAGLLKVESYSNITFQKFTSFSSTPSNQQTYHRSFSSGTWSPWKKLIDSPSLINSLMGNSVTDQSNANFVGKVAGSTTANPHFAGRRGVDSTPQPPTASWVELNNDSSNIGYQRLQTLDVYSVSQTSTTVNAMGSLLFSFNLIAHIERTYGTIPAVDTAGKVAWLKTNISRLTFNWHGFGSSPTGNKASVTFWNTTGSAWSNAPLTNTGSSVSKISWSASTVTSYIGNDGFVHYVAYADPSDGVTASTILTDYVELVVDLDTSLKKNLSPIWLDAVLQNGWVEFETSQKPQYSLGSNGFVTLKGAVKSGTFGSSTPVYYLPTGMRPPRTVYLFATGVIGNVYRVIINSTGNVYIEQSVGTNGNAFVSLDGIRFSIT